MKVSLTFAVALVVAGIHFTATSASAQTTSINSGSLGAAGNGTNSPLVTLGLPSPIFAGGANAVGYANNTANTVVPFNAALNPASNLPFTIEFWAQPNAIDTDDAVISNRYATGNRSGWIIYQRSNGWNLRMYNGSGGTAGWELLGGTAPVGAWSHVVATWSGSAAILYVNGTVADNTNDVAGGIYNANTAVNSPAFSVGALFDGLSPSNVNVDEVAFYGSALTPTQISDHFALANSPTPGAYSSKVLADGAIEYLANVPEPASVGLMIAGGALLFGRRQRRRA